MLMPGLFASVVDVSAGCLLRISRRLSLELEISLICRFGGTVVKSTGDGHLTTFDGPTQAIRCAEAVRADAETLGMRSARGARCPSMSRATSYAAPSVSTGAVMLDHRESAPQKTFDALVSAALGG